MVASLSAEFFLSLIPGDAPFNDLGDLDAILGLGLGMRVDIPERFWVKLNTFLFPSLD